jgi:hypothetical protein
MNHLLVKALATAYFPLALLAFAALFVLMSPVIFFPIGGDDEYWLLIQPERYNNSLFASFISIIGASYDFTGVPRTVSLTNLFRVWQAMFVMNTSVFFGFSPIVVWSTIKILLVSTAIFTLWHFLKSYKFRSRSGPVSILKRKTRIVLVLLLPLALTTTLEVPSVGLSNGWIFYPFLTYLPFVISLLVSLALLKSHDLLARNFRRHLLPVSALLLLVASALNLSYELWLVSVPFALLVLLLDPVTGESKKFRRLTPKIWVGGLFGGSFSAIFIWTRIQIARMPCFESNTCYNGTVVEADLGNVFKNFVSALPGQGLEPIFSPDGVQFSSSLLAVGSIATLALMLGLMAHYLRLRLHLLEHTDNEGHETVGLLKLTSLMVFLALASAIITGITARAAERLVDPLTPYRSGPSIALALSVAAIALVLISIKFFDRNTLVKKSILVIAVSLVIMFSASNFAMNLPQTRIQAQKPANLIIQAIHWEVALGASGDQAILRRCLLLNDARTLLGEQAEIRFIPGAEKAFNLYWGREFCSGTTGD